MSMPTYFISHGGGPWPWMPEAQAMYAPLRAALKDIPRQLGRTPKAMLMVSAHWEARGDHLLVASAERPEMVYDYYGFPPHTYEIRYPAPGNPQLAGQVRELLQSQGLPTREDAQRGFDHGAFVPAYCIYPHANVPMVQLSIHGGYDPALHYSIGQALAPLRAQDILIIGSGLSYHNLRNMGAGGVEPSAQFDQWLDQSLSLDDADQRRQALLDWEHAPAARIAHPREDHLVPLMVAVGAAHHEAAHRFHHETQAFGGLTVSSYRFGQA
ncbi:DODA-type extradiol aromatic ring-opening family dioxygenase [Alcaligenes sp. Marseille-Q7550]